MNDTIKKKTLDLLQTQAEINDSYFTLLRNITSISTGLLAILIALKPDHITDPTAKVLFLITISLLGIGILSIVIAQYGETDLLKRTFVKEKEMLIDYIENEGNNKFKLEYIPPSKLYTRFEYIAFISLILAVLSLIGYAFAVVV